MPTDQPASSGEPLQLDVVEHLDGPHDAEPTATRVVCTTCATTIEREYHHVAGKPVCEACRRVAEARTVVPRGPVPLARAALFALGAAIAGAIVYYGVIALTGLEIGIVAILIGYMVGYAVQRATGGRGGRRFQILAVVFTYWSVGLAYTPVAVRELTSPRGKADSTAVADSTRARGATTPSTGGDMRPATAVAYAVAFSFALPLLVVVGSLPGGLLSGVIIFIGLRQAWRMTAAPTLRISGPYRVGGGSGVGAREA